MTGDTNAVSMTRREAISIGMVAVVGASAGCSEFLSGGDAPDVDWPMFQYDAANTGHADVSGPTGDVTARWSAETVELPTYWMPAVADDSLYISDGTTLYALDTASGDDRWQVEIQGAKSPAVVDGTVYAGAGPDESAVYALDSETGEEEWEFPTEDRIIGATTVVDDTVYVSSADKHLYAVDAETGEEQWSRESGPIFEATPAVADGTIYAIDALSFIPAGGESGVLALDAETGEERWQFDLPGAGGTPVVVDDTVYTVVEVDEGTEVYALDAASGDKEWRVEIDDIAFRSPAVAHDTIYVPGTDLRALDVETGDERWRTESIDAHRSEPTATEAAVYLTGRGGRIHALDTDTGDQRWSYEIATRDEIGPSDYAGTPPVATSSTVYVGSITGTVYALEES